MFERFFACILRLYPARFRCEYGAEALRLVRERARDERGFGARMRLCFDLLTDLAIALPHEYFGAHGSLVSAPVHADGIPTFSLLEKGHPRTKAMMLGALASLLTLASFPALMNRYGNFRPPAGWDRAFNRFSEGFWSEHTARQRQESGTPQSAVPGATQLDPATRHRVMMTAAEAMKQHYPDPATAQKAADALVAHEKNGDDNSAATVTDLAQLLTAQLREAADDHDVELLYRERPIPERPEGPPPAIPAAMREQMLRANCGFAKVDVLPHNIGYIKLDSFAMPAVCSEIARSSMAKVNDAEAVIFDLRDNRGGFDLGSTIAAYLFDHPEYWYSPIENTTRDSWTHSPVAGSKLVSKPVYILTSSRTISAAEQFCYNLKMLKRATLVGETTAGGAHAANFHSIGGNFYLGTVEVHAINPYSKYDWNGTGIEPDVKVAAADALDRAAELARKSGHK